MTSNTQFIKGKINKLNLTKIKIFYSAKCPIMRKNEIEIGQTRLSDWITTTSMCVCALTSGMNLGCELRQTGSWLPASLAVWSGVSCFTSPPVFWSVRWEQRVKGANRMVGWAYLWEQSMYSSDFCSFPFSLAFLGNLNPQIFIFQLQ